MSKADIAICYNMDCHLLQHGQRIKGRVECQTLKSGLSFQKTGQERTLQGGDA